MKLITGNLLDIRTGTILHQVNCLGATGGLAGALHKKWPAAFESYFAHCRRERARALGSVVVAEAEPGLFIAHVFGQFNPGPNTDMAAVHQSLRDAAEVATAPIYAPYLMGCGLGGGVWSKYQAALEAAFPDIIIVQRPEDVRG